MRRDPQRSLHARTEEGPRENPVRRRFCPQVRKTGLTRRQPRRHLDLGLAASGTVRKFSLFFMLLIVVLRYGSPSIRSSFQIRPSSQVPEGRPWTYLLGRMLLNPQPRKIRPRRPRAQVRLLQRKSSMGIGGTEKEAKETRGSPHCGAK